MENTTKYSRVSENGKGQRSDSEFLWALDLDSNLKEWQRNFKDFLSRQNKSYNLYKQAMNSFIDYLLYFPNITRTPREYVTISNTIENSFSDYLITIKQLKSNSQGLRNNLSKMYDFFEWYLVNNCIEENSDTPIINHLKYYNPIEKISINKNNTTETMRNALATRYLKMLEEIIKEDDFAWAKKSKRNWGTINGEEIWNPVLSYLVLLKLKLPLRSHQLRSLDSGEADKYTFNYDQWKWEKNNAITSNNENKGVLRRIIDRNTNKEFVGLFINTNKTKDIDATDRGYTIPWENKEVIKIICDLIEWQKKHNPVKKPLKWTDINDIQLKKKSKQQLKDLGENIFLFRDIFNENPESPVKDSRIQDYWKRLLAELERRINKHKEENENISFIENWQGTKPSKAYYDLHSLRVTNLTALYEAGVPYSILSKYLAGHSSILMTMYYTKQNITHITEVLNQATKIVEQNEQTNFNEFIANKNYENLNDSVVFNSFSSIEAISQLDKGNYMTSDIGICPVGENKCHEGGEAISDSPKTKKIYAPVEGGPKNCLRCRFFITGVPFLLGLTSKFNELSVLIKEKVTIYKEAEKEFELLFSQRYKNEKEGIPFTKWKDLELADSNHNRHNNELNQLLKDWQQLYNLIEQCLVIKENKKKNDDKKLSLITIGDAKDINSSIIECSEFELYDTVCQSSVFYKSIQPNVANIKRGKIINKMLMYNDMKPYFLLLDDKESLEIGNEFVKLLMLKLGKPNAIDIMNEKKKLSDLGISMEIEQGIQNLLNNKYEFKNKSLVKVNDGKSN